MKNEFALQHESSIRKENGLFVFNPAVLGPREVIRAMISGGKKSGYDWHIEGIFTFNTDYLGIGLFGTSYPGEKYGILWSELLQSYLDAGGKFIVSTSGLISAYEPDLENTILMPFGAKPTGLAVLEFKCSPKTAAMFNPYIDEGEERQKIAVQAYREKYPSPEKTDRYDSKMEKWRLE